MAACSRIRLTGLELHGLFEYSCSRWMVAEQMFNPTKRIEDSARPGCNTGRARCERQRVGSGVVTYREGESQVVHRDDVRRLQVQ